MDVNVGFDLFFMVKVHSIFTNFFFQSSLERPKGELLFYKKLISRI